MKLLGLGIVIIATGAPGCSLAARVSGPSGTGPSASSGTGPTTSPRPHQPPNHADLYGDARPAAPADGVYHDLPPYPSAPADPWAGVDGDQPKRWSAEAADDWVVRGNEGDCSAAHDHCLVTDTWFIVRDRDLERGKEYGSNSEATVHVFGPKEPAQPANTGSVRVGDPYTAFRTVPATKTNIAPGSIVIGLNRTTPKLGSGQHAVNAYWSYGVVEEVDFDVGTYKCKNARDTSVLTGARVVVLSWHPGEKVKIVGGKKRDQLAVKASDVFLPDK
jgi:hypothetical protein